MLEKSSRVFKRGPRCKEGDKKEFEKVEKKKEDWGGEAKKGKKFLDGGLLEKICKKRKQGEKMLIKKLKKGEIRAA